jgi:TatD DNase family protein
VIDFHCHLDLYPNPAEVRDECDKRGMYVLSVTTTPSAWRQTSALSADVKRIRTSLGLHPQIAHERLNELTLFDELLASARYIGEIGLDGGPEFRPHWQTQLKAFEHILTRCSEAGGRIMSLHSRRASRAVLDSLESFPMAGTPVLHWFSGSPRDLDRAIRLGCWFSVGPAMLASENGQALAARMPRERVLTESDGPFAQINGETVMPWHVERSISDLARLWSLSPTEGEDLLESNLRSLLASNSRSDLSVPLKPSIQAGPMTQAHDSSNT